VASTSLTSPPLESFAGRRSLLPLKVDIALAPFSSPFGIEDEKRRSTLFPRSPVTVRGLFFLFVVLAVP